MQIHAYCDIYNSYQNWKNLICDTDGVEDLEPILILIFDLRLNQMHVNIVKCVVKILGHARYIAQQKIL